MSLDELKKFFKSLRFKLTIFYSLVLFLFISAFVFGINAYLDNYFKSEPPQPPWQQNAMIQDSKIHENMMKENYEANGIEYTEVQRKQIREMRLKDLKKIQEVSIWSLVPVTVLSSAVGYYISGKFLFPLKELRKRLAKLGDKNLGSQIEIKNKDEIGEIAMCFNDMSLRLKKSFDSQSQFVQDASHELKTPLAIIQTNLENSIDNSQASKQELKNSIEEALTGIKRISKLTQNLLDITLPNKTQKKLTSINNLILEQYNLLKDYADKYKVDFSIIPLKQDVKLKIDKVLVGRALFNIIENAIKYSKDAKEPKVFILTEEHENKIQIIIKDNGIGIPKESQEKIFDRFYRVDQSRSRESGGFGLGLAISKKIIEDHKGTISVTSKPGNTEFIITI